MSAVGPKKKTQRIEDRPAWNENGIEDPHKYRASMADVMKKKVAMMPKTKNKMRGKEEWRAKMDALQRGFVPDEYQEIVGPKKKKFKAN